MTVADRLVLYGVESSYSVDLIESMYRGGIELAASVITGELEWDLLGIDSPFEEPISDRCRGMDCLVPWVTPGWRKERVDQALSSGLLLAGALVDATAVIPRAFSIGKGSYINAGAIIGAQCEFGYCVMIGRNASVGHQSTLDDFVSVGPGATIASKVVVQRGSVIGAGATVAPDVKIGSNSVVASGASVFRDVPDNVVVVGNPARIAKSGMFGLNGVGV